MLSVKQPYVTEHPTYKHQTKLYECYSENLSDLWVAVCNAETLWLSCKAHNKKARLKSEYTNIRMQSDREVQRTKRLYW